MANIFAQNHSNTSKGRLLRWVRIDQLSTWRARPYISLCFICASSR